VDRAKKINVISVLLALTALVMIILGYMVKMPAPAITGIGFLLMVWALQVLK
jgi:4-hydroxybenzoate polyprenyltransferase